MLKGVTGRPFLERYRMCDSSDDVTRVQAEIMEELERSWAESRERGGKLLFPLALSVSFEIKIHRAFYIGRWGRGERGHGRGSFSPESEPRWETRRGRWRWR